MRTLPGCIFVAYLGAGFHFWIQRPAGSPLIHLIAGAVGGVIYWALQKLFVRLFRKKQQ